jgi:methyl-accepting chemotaxis protein
MKYIRWSTWAQKLGRRLSFLSAMSIATRLHVGFGSLLVLIAALGSLGWVQTSHLSARTEKIVSEDAKRASLANDLQIAVQQMVIALGSLSTRSDMEDRKFYNGQFETAVTAFTSAKAEMKKLDVPNEAPIWLESMRKVEEIDVEAIRIFKDVAKAATEGDSSPASMQRLYDEQVAGPAATLIEALGGLRGAMSQSMLAAAARSKEQASRTQLGSALMVALALVGGIIASTLIARGISRPMTQAVLLAKAVATGDLSAREETHRQDEIGALLRALSDMQTGLRTLVGEIRSCADSIQSASADVASGNADLSHRTERAAANLQETASSIEELTGAAKQSASSAGVATQLALSATEAASNGGQVIQRVVDNMSAISTSSKRITEIVAVIDGIAFQTNILALNAAVEASRAGEQGRGFAVVAGEVRSLAQRCAGAAREIRGLIETSVSRVESGSGLVREAGSAMSGIMSSVKNVNDMVTEIRTSSLEQTVGIEQVNGAVNTLDQMTQQNAALVEQSAAAAQSLRDQAKQLNRLVDSFTL